jgi:hypothetical protein
MFRRTHIVEQFIKSGSKERGWFWLRLCEGDARGGKRLQFSLPGNAVEVLEQKMALQNSIRTHFITPLKKPPK